MSNLKIATSKQGWMTVFMAQLPMMAIIALMPALPTIMGHFDQVPNKQLLVPMILTAPGLCVAIIAPFAGYFIDRFGRRRFLLIFMTLYGIGGTIPFFLDNFNTVIIGRFLLGIGEGFVITIGNVLIGDYFGQKERTKWLTIQGVFGFLFGALLLYISGYLASLGWNYPFLVYSLAIILSILGYFYIFEPQHNENLVKKSFGFGAGFPWSTIIKIFFPVLIAAILYFVYTIHFSLALDEKGIKDQKYLGTLTAIASFGMPIGAFMFKYISGIVQWKQFALTALFIGIGLIGIGSISSISITIIFAIIQQIGCGMTLPIVTNWSLKLLPEEFRGRGMGFWAAAFNLGQFLNPAYVNMVRGLTGSLLATFFVTGIISLVFAAFILALNILKKNK